LVGKKFKVLKIAREGNENGQVIRCVNAGKVKKV
jgi:hypothetical protein